MTGRTLDVPLDVCREVIPPALEHYTEISQGEIAFDINTAEALVLTPDKPNAARSVSEVRHLGKTAGKLFVIVFVPGDGTGDESSVHLQSLDTRGYPRSTKVLPQGKQAAHSEVHLTIASLSTAGDTAKPALFAGNQHLVGQLGNALTKLGEVGQSVSAFQWALAGEEATGPAVTYTTGYREDGRRFGDPHALYNPHPAAIQVCGFIAVTPDMAAEHAVMFEKLGAVPPAPYSLPL